MDRKVENYIPLTGLIQLSFIKGFTRIKLHKVFLVIYFQVHQVF